MRVFAKKTPLILPFLQQETIEVESENVFKLAAFALQVRKSLSQAFYTEILSLTPNVNEDGRGQQHLKTVVS